MIDIIVIQPDGKDIPSEAEDILKYCGDVQGLSGANIAGALWRYDLFPSEPGPKVSLFRIADEVHDPSFITVLILGMDLDLVDFYWPAGLKATILSTLELLIESDSKTTSQFSSSGNTVLTILSKYARLREVLKSTNRKVLRSV